MDIQVLVASMHQTDTSLVKKMNIQTDAIFANQCDRCSDENHEINGNTVQYINRTARGVGQNRNTALLYSDGDILTFADDDMVFIDEYEKIIIEAFEKIPNADAIIFNIDTVGTNMGRRTNNKIKRVRFYNALNYGAARISVKSIPVKREKIMFHTCFGGGTRYNAGEDVLFVCDMLKHHLKIYTYPVCIASVDQTTSTWFKGYDEKYFHDKGALFAAISKKWAKFLCLQFLVRHKNLFEESDLSFNQKYRLMKDGIRSLKELRTFKEVKRDCNFR